MGVGWMNKWMGGCVMDGWIDKWIGRWMGDGCVDEWMMDGWMDG